MSAQEHSVTEVTPTLALASTQERLTVPMSSSVIPTSGAPANDTIDQLAAGEVAAIAVSSILVVLMTVVVVSAVVTAVCYVQKRQRRKRLILDAVCSNEQGVHLVSAAQPHRSHHLFHISEGTSAKQDSAPSSIDSPLQSSVRTPRTCGDRSHPYSCLESHYEEVVAHYVTEEMGDGTVNFTVYDGFQSLSTSPKGLAASTPTRTVYTVVPVKAVRLTKSEQTPVHLHEIRTGLDATCVKYEMVPFKPPSIHVDGLYQQLAGRRCIEMPRSVLDIKESIGSGEFGNVYRGLWETPYGPEEVAIKVLKTETNEEDKVRFLQEAAIMTQFRHPHIVRLLGAVTVDEPTMLVLEYLKLGNLMMWLQRTRHELADNHTYLSTLPNQLLQFCREIADGMNYLSNKGFVHRDLAARNILLDGDLKCHIGDFGLSRDLTSGEQNISRGKIPIRWTAPEAIFQHKYSTQSDVWSYGMLLYEIWSVGRRPFSSLQSQEVLHLLQSTCGPLLPPPPGCPWGVYKMMVHCWSKDHHQRPSFLELLQQISSLEEDREQLKVPEASLRGIQDPQRASRLGSPLVSSEQLYKELQCNWIS